MYEQFTSRAEAVGAEVHRVHDKAAAVEFICRLLQQEGLADAPGCRAVWAPSPCLDAATREMLEGQTGLSLTVTRELAAESRFGISQLNWALADTGSLVQDATAVEQRLVSTLPDIHIALVPTSGILPDMPALLSCLHPNQSNYIAFITGPSRTADIERVLTIGVHGPGRLVIVCVDEM